MSEIINNNEIIAEEAVNAAAETSAAAATVAYDRSSMITIYTQPTDTSCAATCAAMCVKKSPQTLQNEGFDLGWADWSGIASKYGYSTNGWESAGLSNVLAVLKEGYPVIVKVNESNPHWVVVTKYSGSATSPSASNFTCADPSTGKSVKLSSATRYSSVTKMVVFR
ncbi:MAG: C39 family peptidase [Eubacterium sp.]|nr:C39 family peptidase [Eubacterium sp.]